jgi:hypothetical protein
LVFAIGLCFSPEMEAGSMLTTEDTFLECLERWKKRAISTFALISFVMAMLMVLVIEVHAFLTVLRFLSTR